MIENYDLTGREVQKKRSRVCSGSKGLGDDLSLNGDAAEKKCGK
jgi:hypothetical protein